MPLAGENNVLWTPSPERAERSRMAEFIRLVRAEHRMHGGTVPHAGGVRDYASLYRWSVEHPEEFWPLVWRFCGVIADRGGERETPWDEVVVGLDRMAPPDPVRGPRWFTGARLNFAENLLRSRDERPALVFWNELGCQRELTYGELQREVARAAAALRADGIGPLDRVAGFLPNMPETVIAMLAATSLGAVWSSCSPDFGTRGVVDRFGQIAPRVLICADAYRYAGKVLDCLERARDIARAIPTIERFVVVSYLRSGTAISSIPNAVSWRDWLERGESGVGSGEWKAGGGPLPTSHSPLPTFPFDHPVYIMYSSGTTGMPKCMVHGAGGTLLQHLKELVLHTDLRRKDRIFYFTTCGWMMWNWLVSSLAVGARVILYDGAPLAPTPSVLWDVAEREGVTVFGTSAKYLALAEKAGVEPARTHDLSALRTILSTGSPLAAHSYDYVYRSVKADVQLASISGGTDLISCFALGVPLLPVYRGDIQARGLGMAVEIWNEEGRPVRGEPGELVCTRPFPSMPVAFWNDADGDKYRRAYFDFFPGVWRHGDWAELTPHDGLVIYGRSDATLNPGGVRIGTAEIYRQVEQLPEVVESIVVGQEVDGDATDVRIVLFVRLRDGLPLDDALRDRIRRQIRENTSPHHVPKKIIQVADIPRTISGKITELAVRDVIHGRPVKNVDALANPGALELFRDLPELRE